MRVNTQQVKEIWPQLEGRPVAAKRNTLHSMKVSLLRSPNTMNNSNTVLVYLVSVVITVSKHRNSYSSLMHSNGYEEDLRWGEVQKEDLALREVALAYIYVSWYSYSSILLTQSLTMSRHSHAGKNFDDDSESRHTCQWRQTVSIYLVSVDITVFGSVS